MKMKFRRRAEWEWIADTVKDIRLIHPHTAIINMPYLDTGDLDEDTQSKVYIPMSDLLPKIFATVLKTKDCIYIKPGDTIMFLPNHALDYLCADTRRVWAIDERAAQVSITGWR